MELQLNTYQATILDRQNSTFTIEPYEWYEWYDEEGEKGTKRNLGIIGESGMNLKLG